MKTFGQFNDAVRGVYAAQEQARNARQQRLAKHLHECGPRPVLEALLAVNAGRDIDKVLDDFARLPSDTYKAVGADVLPIDEVTVIEGGTP